MDYLSFSSGAKQSDTSKRDLNKNLEHYYTHMWIEIGQSEKR